MQINDHHKQPVEIVDIAKRLMLNQILLVDTKNRRLQRHIASLHEIAKTQKQINKQPIQNNNDHRIPTNAKTHQQNSRVEQHAISNLGPTDELNVRQRVDQIVVGHIVKNDSQLLHTQPESTHNKHHTKSPSDHKNTP